MIWLESYAGELAALLGQGRGMAGLIFLLSSLFWALVIERYWYFYLRYPRQRDESLRRWRYSVKSRRHARFSRRRILRGMRLKTGRSLVLIGDLLQVIVLLGLLGLSGGLLLIFNALSFPGVVYAATLRDGILAAAVPMIAALAMVATGAYFVQALRSRAAREIRLFADRLRHG